MTKVQNYIVSFNFRPALTEFSFFQLNNNENFVQAAVSKAEFLRLSKSVFSPAIKKLKETCQSGLRASIFLNGSFLQFADQYAPELLAELKHLEEANSIEILGGSFYNSTITSLEFLEFSINKHKIIVKKLLGIKVESFYSPCGMYSDELGRIVDSLGFKNYLFEPPLWLTNDSELPLVFSNPGNKKLRLIPLGSSRLIQLSVDVFSKLHMKMKSKQVVADLGKSKNLKPFGSKYMVYSDSVLSLQKEPRYNSIMMHVKRLLGWSDTFQLLGLATDFDELTDVVSHEQTDGYLFFMNRLAEIELSETD